jgi:hypothetical protein
MKKTVSLFCMAMICCTSFAQQKVYTLADWDIKDWNSQKGELELDVSEYKLNYNHPLPFQDMQSSWRVKADLKCGTLGTEQVFVCKEGKGTHLLGRISLNGDISVIKRNFMDDISSFRAQSFPECDEKNQKVDSFNHQLTGGFVGLYDENGGIVVANARQVLSSMAHCPMRLEKDKTVRMNPFGTYYGKQRHHFSRANDEILETYTLVAAQGKSIAPS